MRDCCEYCGNEMPAKDKKKHKNYYYHAKCKQYQKEREAA